MTPHVNEIVAEYLLGDLAGTQRADMEAHLEACACCRDEVHAEADALANFALCANPIVPSCELRHRVLDTLISRRYRYAPFVQRLSTIADLDCERAASLLEKIQDESVWTDSPWPPLKICAFAGGPSTGDAIVAFAKLPLGQAFPAHRHLGEERYLIIQGVCAESDGSTVRAGEVVRHPAGSEHAFVSIGDCDLVFAVVVPGIELRAR